MRRRVLERRARRELLWAALAFVSLQLGLGVAIEHCLPRLRDPVFDLRAAQLARRARSPGRPLTVVMLGSSRVVNGFRAGALEAPLARSLDRPAVVFNFGTPAAGPVVNLMHLRRLEDRGLRPDFLFIEVAPSHLAVANPSAWEVRFVTAPQLRQGELNFLKRYDFPVTQLRHDWWQAALVPCYGHRVEILSRVAPGLLPPLMRLDRAPQVDGPGWREWASQLSDEARRRAREINRQDHQPVLQAFRLGGRSCRALADLLERCRRHGIPAALVWMPEGPAFRSWYRAGAADEIRTFLADLGARYGAPLVDAHEWLGEDDFIDSNHLMPDGASRFTERFGREILVPLLKAYYGGSPAIKATCLPDRGSARIARSDTPV